MKRINLNLKAFKSLILLCFLIQLSSCGNGEFEKVSEYLDSGERYDRLVINDTTVIIDSANNSALLYSKGSCDTLHRITDLHLETNCKDCDPDICKGLNVFSKVCHQCHFKEPNKECLHNILTGKEFIVSFNSIDNLDSLINQIDNGEPAFVSKKYFIKNGPHDYYWTIKEKDRLLLLKYLKSTDHEKVNPCFRVY